MTFSEKDLVKHPGSMVSYRHVDRWENVQFPWKIGHSIVYPGVIIDTGSSGPSFVINEEIFYELGLKSYSSTKGHMVVHILCLLKF